MDPPPSSPPALISFVGGPNQSSSHLHLSRQQQLRSRPSESDAEPEAEYRREGLTHGPVVHHNIQPLQCNPSDDDDDDENNVADSTLQLSHSPQHLLLPSEINDDDDDDDDDDQFRQRIAQKMLTATTTRHSPASSSTRNINHQIFWEEEEDEINDVQFHSIPGTRYFPAPWETPPLPPPPPPSPPSYYPPPLNNFSRMQEPMAASNTTIIDDNAMVMHSIPMTAMAAATTTTTNTTTTTPKSVTFRTQDQVHQFDEQLELFKYVDEEFFLVAHYLLEVVDFEDRTDNIIDHHHDDHSGIVFGKEDPLTFSEGGTDRRRHRDGRPGPGLLSRLCGCGLGVGNDADDDDGYGMQNESINEELHNNEIEHNQRNNDWRGYQLSTKLVSNFVSALNFRMENIQSKLDGDEEIGEEDALVAARTREVVRKVNTYGLPLMIPQHSSRCEWNVPSKFIALDTNNVVNQKSFGRGGKNRGHFPVLPLHHDELDADEYDTVGIDENDRNLDNQQQVVVARFKSSYPRSPSSKKDIAASNQTPKLPPTPPCTSLFSSLFKQNPQSSTTNTTTSILPSENSCRKRLAQISHEIHKATSMMHRTQIKSVHIACSQRITKLQNERRWYQIIQERHKIQSMMMSTRVESVVLACRERLKQLVIELESVQRYDIMEGNGAENEQLAYTSSAFANAEYDDAMVVEEDGNNRWYDRVLRYVQGPATDERIHEDELADYYARERQHHYPSPGTTRYEGEGRHQHATYAMLYPPVAHAASATTTTQCGSLHDYM